MSRASFEFRGCLTVLTPLHVGSGDFATIAGISGKDGSNIRPEVATVARDALGRPYLPATSIKGMLRGLAEEVFPQADIDRLFGALKADVPSAGGDGRGRTQPSMGAVQCRGASLARSADARDVMPYVASSRRAAEIAVVEGREERAVAPGCFIAARTSIDADAGTAKDTGLHFREMVAPNSSFDFRIHVECFGPGAEARAETEARNLARILRLVASKQGRPLGGGRADGDGRVRLDPDTVEVVRRALDQNGDFVSKPVGELWKTAKAAEANTAPEAHRDVIRLVCHGPFLIVDASTKAKREAPVDDQRRKAVHLRPQRSGPDVPLILGSSLSGALRARAQWLEALMHEAGELKRKSFVAGIDPDSRRPIIRTAADAETNLAPVDRLFGVTGFRGLLTIEDLEVTGVDGRTELTSVKLDRFSGAPIDGALFTTEAFVGVRLSFALRLAPRRSDAGSVTVADAGLLFERLMQDIGENGLQLGAGASKGFGWFEKEASHGAR